VNQVPSRIDSKAHRGDFFVDVLGTIRVKELMPYVRKVELIPENMSFQSFKQFFSATQQQYFPVVDRHRMLTGIFSINDIRSVLFSQDIGALVVMKDIANVDIIVTTPSEDLNEVMKKFTVKNIQGIPVVKDEDRRVLLGMLDRREVIQFYNKRVQEIKTSHQRLDIESDREVSQLKRIPVQNAMRQDILTVAEDMPLHDLESLFYGSKFRSFPVVDHEGRLKGLLSFSDYQQYLNMEQGEAKSAIDLATRAVATVMENDTLFLALSRITQGDFAILPVLDSSDPERVMGVISRRDILSSYDELVIQKGLNTEKA
jgi:CIC family chloride channel protein